MLINTTELRAISRLMLLLVLLSSTPFSFAQSNGSIINDHGAPQFQALGFGEFTHTTRNGEGVDGFSVGQVVAHLSASLGPALTVFGEFTATGKDSEYSTEVERLIVKYDFSDLVKLSAGRYHTPIGYWNSAFHHGSWLQTTTSRPEMVKFGSQFTPIHFVGVLMEGSLPKSTMGWNYKVGFGNGRHGNFARAGDAGDINSDTAWVLRLGATPRAVKGLNLGLGFYGDKITVPASPSIDESIISAFLIWSDESPELMAEYFHAEHKQQSGPRLSGGADAWYVQFAWRLNGRYSNFKPYARVEQIDVDTTDPLLADTGMDYDAALLGLRWDFNPYADLKAEYRNEAFANGRHENVFRVQVSFVLTRL